MPCARLTRTCCTAAATRLTVCFWKSIRRLSMSMSTRRRPRSASATRARCTSLSSMPCSGCCRVRWQPRQRRLRRCRQQTSRHRAGPIIRRARPRPSARPSPARQRTRVLSALANLPATVLTWRSRRPRKSRIHCRQPPKPKQRRLVMPSRNCTASTSWRRTTRVWWSWTCMRRTNASCTRSSNTHSTSKDWRRRRC
ncbi:MAG: hypothetical protein AW09_000272 [Candidatus Accumulibacter phosphatis]|uniref:Uncharacterized protein n=1 Tax=Candidatus Accumulibacter phosphatis TaxID=327160 RepID=A0A080M263_9PROT|nr:MAG: hypothetical protein AW09_000272 [Candidatus Accumulibacter phosphatis]